MFKKSFKKGLGESLGAGVGTIITLGGLMYILNRISDNYNNETKTEQNLNKTSEDVKPIEEESL